MLRNLKFWRLWSRYLLGTTLVLAVTIIALTMLFESESLAGVPGEAWTLMGGAILGLVTALTILARAMAKNPDSKNGSDDDDE